MKRIIALAFVLVLALSLVACGGEKFKCDLCEEEKSGKKYTESLFGVEMTMCKSCHDDYTAGMDAIGDLDLGDLEGLLE